MNKEYMTIEHLEKESESVYLTPLQSINLTYPCESKTNCSQYNITLPRGIYYLEAWGA